MYHIMNEIVISYSSIQYQCNNTSGRAASNRRNNDEEVTVTQTIRGKLDEKIRSFTPSRPLGGQNKAKGFNRRAHAAEEDEEDGSDVDQSPAEQIGFELAEDDDVLAAE